MPPKRTTPQPIGPPLSWLALLPGVALVLFLVLILEPTPRAPALEPERGQETSINRAVFADGRLWVLSDAGALSSITERADKRVPQTLPEPVFDLCVQDGRLLAITGAREGGKLWTIRRRTTEAWSALATIPRKDEHPLAMICGPQSITLLTTKRIVELGSGASRTIPLSGSMRFGVAHTVHATPEALYLGVNAGEWGGGLHRIDRVTGQVVEIEKAIGDICGRPLDTDCDPVNGIATMPWKPDCIAAAIGLVHMSPHGRIVEVCGTQVRRMYFKAYDDGGPNKPAGPGEEPFSTVAFFGLTRQGDTLWAPGIDGVYRFRDGRLADVIPLPEFKQAGDVYVSFDLPDVVLVLTEVQRRVSVSGAAPLIVPR